MSLAGLFQPVPFPNKFWEDISMDFFVNLPKSHGLYSILAVVDHVTKYAHFIHLVHPFTAKIIAAEFVQEVV